VSLPLDARRPRGVVSQVTYRAASANGTQLTSFTLLAFLTTATHVYE
jgi:uncharacterized protein (DUF1778 family)